MADDIQVDFIPSPGQLSLSGGDAAFARVLAAVVVAKAGSAGAVNGVPAGVRVVLIGGRADPTPPARLQDRLPLLGCGVVGCAFLFVLATGLGTIAGWVR